jgi:small-conductance mechanosensitive channel
MGIQKGLFAIFIFSFTFVLARIVAQLIELKATNDGSPLRSTSIITNIAKIVVYIIGLLFLLQSMGISIAPLITALGVGGLAVALALQEPLTNLFAGIQIIASGKIKTGDYVQLNSGEEGFVEDIAWRSTSIKALANQIIIVPNNKLANAIVRNYMTPDPENGILVNLGVAYHSDLDKVETVTVEVATQIMKEVEGGIPDFTPFIRYNNFNQSSIDFSVIMRGRQFTDQFLIKHEFIRRLMARYDKEGINIPYPIRTVYLKTEKESGQFLKEGSDK